MNLTIATVPYYSPSGDTAQKMMELCVPANPTKKNLDGGWVEIPGRWDIGQSPQSCWIDMWGEKTCSEWDHIIHLRDGQKKSCQEVYDEDPATFEAQRGFIESRPWTIREMKKVIKWIFNCSGKLPLKACPLSVNP